MKRKLIKRNKKRITHELITHSVCKIFRKMGWKSVIHTTVGGGYTHRFYKEADDE